MAAEAGMWCSGPFLWVDLEDPITADGRPLAVALALVLAPVRDLAQAPAALGAVLVLAGAVLAAPVVPAALAAVAPEAAVPDGVDTVKTF